MATIKYNLGDSGDAFSATTGSNIATTTTGPLDGATSWAYTSSTAANYKTFDLASGYPTAYTVWMKFRASSWGSGAQRIWRALDSAATVSWHVDVTGTGDPGKLRLRPTNSSTLTYTTPAVVSLDTTYIFQINVNHSTGLLRLIVRDSTGAILDDSGDFTGLSIGTNGDRLDTGAVLSSVAGLNYLFDTLYWEDTYSGPTGPPPGVADYHLTENYSANSSTPSSLTVDATGSTGTVTLVQASGTTATITEPTTGTFTVTNPAGTDTLTFTLTADGTPDDTKMITWTRGGAAAPNVIVFSRFMKTASGWTPTLP